MMPIEQITMGHLQTVNKALGYSIRPFGVQSVHELQFLAFMSNCPNCSLISHWDFGVEELDEILRSPQQPPFAQITWVYAPDAIAHYLESAPDWLKPNLQALLDMLKQMQSHGEKK